MRFLSALLLLTIVTTAAAAQANGGTSNSSFASRSELEANAATAESASLAATSEPLRESKRAIAWTLRERLRTGDFHPGDRIALIVEGHTTMSDTLTVRTGRTLLLPDLPPIELQGVLRAELHAHLTREIGKYIRDPKIRAVPLMRVAILGKVGRPGFYGLPADALLSDAIMVAGGPAADADLAKSLVRRGTERLLAHRDVSTALSDGMTLDQLDVRAGDEIIVGEKKKINVFAALGVVTSLAALFAAVK